MDRHYIDDHHIVARYLAGRLSGAECEAFEAYYVEHPEVVQEMEAMARFTGGLLHLQRSGELETLIRSQRKTLTHWFVASAAALGAFAIAAALIHRDTPAPLLAASPAMLQASDGSTLPITNRLHVFRTRSTEADAIVRLTDLPHAIELEILPELAGTPTRYGVTLARLEDGAERHIADVEGLAIDENGLVHVYMDARTLEPGSYRLTLTNEAYTEAQASSFSLRVEGDAR